MSFYTALTGLNGAQADISATSNNIANVGTTGFKRSRAEFGDIFATSPLQNASSSIGSGTILKGIKQQFTQGNIASSLNALDLAISGQGFFALQPSLTSSQTVYTRNGSFNVDNDRYVVDSAGQYLMTYPVNTDGSVTAKDLDSAVPLQLPVTSGEPKATSNIELGVNVPADAPVITSLEQFADGYQFDPNNSETYTNSTSITIFDDLGNPTIATIYFIKTQAASAEDPTNKFDTRLVINDTVIDPNLVSAVDDAGTQIFIDRFGNQTTQIPDDTYILEGKSTPLYKLDDLQTQIPSQPAGISGAKTDFDFGEEGNKKVEIVTDPLLFNATKEGGSENDIFWGNDFMIVNVDNSDSPVSVNLRAGSYNAEELAAEVERAINYAYGDDRKVQIFKNVDDKLNLDFLKLNTADGTTTSLQSPITVDLLKSSYVTEFFENTEEEIDLTGISPDFTQSQFLSHVQARINSVLNESANATALGVSSLLRETVTGGAIATGDSLYGEGASDPQADYFKLNHNFSVDGAPAADVPRYLSYSYLDSKPTLQVYDDVISPSAVTISDDAITITFAAAPVFNSSTIEFNGPNVPSILNGKKVAFVQGDSATQIKISNAELGLADNTANVDALVNADLLFNPSESVEAYFEGATANVEGVYETFNTRKIVLSEKGNFKYRATSADNALSFDAVAAASKTGALASLGLDALVAGDSFDSSSSSQTWVDPDNPPVKVGYDELNQRLTFSVDRSVLGAGTASGFNSFKVFGAVGATSSNGLGLPPSNVATETLIRGGEFFAGGTFVADGNEIQQNNKRYGVTVQYNSDTKTFSMFSGSTGEAIDQNGAIGVTSDQDSSSIQVGRYTLVAGGEADTDSVTDPDAAIIGSGSNLLMGFGADLEFAVSEARGVASTPAVAQGRTAQLPLTEVFRLNSTNGENIFNVTVNGISGVIEVPANNYVGSTLATALEERINQIVDPETGIGVGGVEVSYSAATNSFSFTTGTTGDTSTIKVKGTAKLGLADVPLGVGNVPKIYNLVQAKAPDGQDLFVNAEGEVTTNKPDDKDLVSGFYPLYIDEGELTFDKTGRLVSPRNNVSYEQQAEGFSISLDIDYSASTQFAQPFSVLSVEQDGFTSGRLDGLEIDSAGTIRANYTNGQNTPLGKIVVANFNNQNGLKQIGNATYVETAVSGTPQVGEAGSEGFGNILSGSLERSNVDITEELVNLITAQRNYQASAKAIETTTSLTQTIINIRM